MSTLITLAFDGTIGNDFNGATSSANYTGGDLQFTGEGVILAKTTVGTGNKWMRFKYPTLQSATNPGAGISLGDSSGNALIWMFYIALGELVFAGTSDYGTYTVWVGDGATADINCGSFTTGQFVGVTFEPSTNSIRIWPNVTAAAPDSVSSWDSGAAGLTRTTETFKSNSNYVGFGSWTGSPGTHSFDDFTAGDFGSSQSNAPRAVHQMKLIGAM